MKKGRVISVIILVILVIGYALLRSSHTETLGIVSNNNLEILTDTFEKKMACASIDINDDIKENRGEFAKEYSIDQIFYSPKRNSCIAIVTLYDEQIRDIWLYDTLSKEWFTTTFLNRNGNCTFGHDDLDSLCTKERTKFYKKVEELK